MASSWSTWLESLAEPPVDPGGAVLVLSAHPDDEVIGLGRWLAGQAGRPLTFVTATDGEASHPGSPSITPEGLRDVRPRELLSALDALGFVAPDVLRLELPDGGLPAHRAELVERLAPLVESADLVLAPFERDGHPDHEVLGDVAVDLCRDRTPLWRFPIWTWAWTEPGDQDWLGEVRVLPSTAEGQERKLRALAEFATQVRPLSDHPADLAVVDEPLLRHATHAVEAVLV